jgi:hypothetical protein
MNKKTYIFLIAFIAFSASKAQVPVDSLLGTYVGQCWYASPPTNPWTITPDTVIVTSIDTINCTALISGSCGGGNLTFYSSYTYCNTPTTCGTFPYCCDKFYSLDSLCILCDDVTPPPPYQNSSGRVYAKRISNKVTGIKDVTLNTKVNIYPDPAIEYLTIETPQKAIIEILNIEGQSIKTITIVDNKAIIALDGLSKGVYIIKATTDKGVVIKKFIKE